MKKTLTFLLVLVAGSCAGNAQAAWDQWPPHDYLVKSLAEAVPAYLKAFHADTGRFGSEPWICSDQNRIFPLAAAWALEDPDNPWFHNAEVLAAIGKGGEALVDAMDERGMWTFRKKDNSTWGQIHMPWTYSRWIRAYTLVREALPAETREKWERGLMLGFTGIRKYADGGTHNIPTHHAMGLYIAGVCFENEDWKAAATRFMARVVSEQDPAGFWSENFGPVVGYNKVYVDALGVYYHFSRDTAVLDALERSARFHAGTLWPDGSAVSCIDERQIYHKHVDIGNVGFTHTPEGRGFLLKQVDAYSNEGDNYVDGDYAASMLLYGGEGEYVPCAVDFEKRSFMLGKNDATIQGRKPWHWALSGYACPPPDNRWIQDRQNLVDIYHETLGLIIGGGNTKLQPYWSTFTVGDPSLLSHTPGDESPDFTPDIPLQWTPDRAVIADTGSEMTLHYGAVECRVSVTPGHTDTVVLTYTAPINQKVEAHIPFLNRSDRIQTATGKDVVLSEEAFVLTAEAIGAQFRYGSLHVSMPENASLRWPAKQHNPYAKDGHSSLSNAKLVLVLPFDKVDTYEVVLTCLPE